MQCDCLVGGELGIALSGGGAKSLAQVGVLKVLDREGVPISYVAGTSAGAIIGAVYVTSSNAFEAEERLLTHLRTTGIGFNAETFALLPGSRTASSPGWLEVGRGFWRATRANGALIGGEEMRASLRVLYGDATFSEARMPFATTALDLVSGRRVIFAGGDLVDATYASSAIPGLFEPLALDDSLLVDGGWAEPVPVNACHHLGAVHVVGVEVPPNTMDVVKSGAVPVALRADALARDLLEEMQLREADYVVRPRVSVRHFADFSDPEGLIAAGERAAEAALDEIRALLERHRALFVRATRDGRGRTGMVPCQTATT